MNVLTKDDIAVDIERYILKAYYDDSLLKQEPFKSQLKTYHSTEHQIFNQYRFSPCNLYWCNLQIVNLSRINMQGYSSHTLSLDVSAADSSTT